MLPSVPSAQLTHVGVFVHDLDGMVDFYCSLLALELSDSGVFLGKELAFLTRSAQEHHQLVLVKGRTGEPTTKVLSQLSFRVNDLASLRHFRNHAPRLGATEMEGRNHGNSWSIYFRDPEYNMVEIYCPTPWQVRQPWRVALDLDQPDDMIVADTERQIHADGVAIPLGQWQSTMSDRIAARTTGHPGATS
jgi:catechol 2,3-dioxygenase